MTWISGPNAVNDTYAVPNADAKVSGPFESPTRPGHLYLVEFETDLTGTAIFHSASLDGTTWDREAAFGGRCTWGTTYNKTIATIAILVLNYSDGLWHILTYNVDSGASGDLVINIPSFQLGVPVIFDDGKIGFLYTTTSASGVFFSVYESGAWRTPVTITSNTSYWRTAIINADTIYAVYRDTTSGMYAVSITESGTVTPLGQISTAQVTDDAYGTQIAIFGTEIFVDLYTDGVYRGSNLTAPAWTKDLSLTNQVDMVASDAKMYAIEAAQTIAGGFLTQDQMVVREYLGGGTWTDPVVGVDFLEHPSPWHGSVAGIDNSHFWSSTLLSDGTIGTSVDFHLPVGTCASTYVQYAVSGAPSPITISPGPGSWTWTGGLPSVSLGERKSDCPPAFELSKVVVSLRPATHLPVRGSSS